MALGQAVGTGTGNREPAAGFEEGARCVPLTTAAIGLVACFECMICGNDRLLDLSANRCEDAGLLRVVHRRTATGAPKYHWGTHVTV